MSLQITQNARRQHETKEDAERIRRVPPRDQLRMEIRVEATRKIIDGYERHFPRKSGIDQ